MEIPTRWGWFHCLWVGLIVLCVTFFIIAKVKGWKLNPRVVFGIYGFGALALELIKQVMWSVHTNDAGAVYWDYPWYCAPFQICTTPMIAAIILVFVKNEKLRDALCSYLAFFTIICTGSAMILPDTCFVDDVIIDVHTMYLHAGGFIASLFVLIWGLTEGGFKSWLRGLIVFVVAVIIALVLDVAVYWSGWLSEGDVFNMFYISPYFPSTLPVFCDLYEILPYPVFLLTYVLAFAVGSAIVCVVVYFLKKIKFTKRRVQNELS